REAVTDPGRPSWSRRTTSGAGRRPAGQENGGGVTTEPDGTPEAALTCRELVRARIGAATATPHRIAKPGTAQRSRIGAVPRFATDGSLGIFGPVRRRRRTATTRASATT